MNQKNTLEHCSGCTDPHSEGTHQMHTIEHPCQEGGDPNCGYCFPHTIQEEGWRNDPIAVAVNEYGNQVVEITNRFIRGETNEEVRDMKWRACANALMKTIRTTRQQVVAEAMEEVREKVEGMKMRGDDHLGSQQNGCSYCDLTRQVNRRLTDIISLLTSQDNKGSMKIVEELSKK